MTEAVYEQLTEAISARPNQLPVIPSAEFAAMAKELFTPEQAEIACSMPIKPRHLVQCMGNVFQTDLVWVRIQQINLLAGYSSQPAHVTSPLGS